jgi:hypothetical protein
MTPQAPEGAWDEWNHWHNQQLAANPDFDAALFGAVDEQVGGCQAEAYLAVHGAGEEAYSKAASLANELRGDIDWLALDQTVVDRWVRRPRRGRRTSPRRAGRRTPDRAEHHRERRLLILIPDPPKRITGLRSVALLAAALGLNGRESDTHCIVIRPISVLR